MKSYMYVSVFVLGLVVSAQVASAAVSNSVTSVVNFGDVATSSVDISVTAGSATSTPATTTSIMAAGQVSTDADIELYVDSLVGNDASVESVDTASQEVEITFNRPVKLFGFISTTMNEKVRVEADAQGKTYVDIDRPWWAAFASVGVEARDVASGVMARISNISSASLKTEWDAALTARVIGETHAAANAAYMDK